MVIHEGGDLPAEVSVIRKPLFEQQTYVIVENHVREIIKKTENSDNTQTSERMSLMEKSDNEKKIIKCAKKRQQRSSNSSSATDSDDHKRTITSEISQADLEELRCVYEQCKAVIKKIEGKYGRLLNLQNEAGSSTSYLQTLSTEDSRCTCPQIPKKKILFDDEGRQKTVETEKELHICPKKPRKTYSEAASQNLQIEYTENEVKLSDNLQDLGSILRNPNIDLTFRNQVISKARSIKQEHLQEIRFNKLSMIEKLKSNSDHVFDFKGSNLSTLPGYPF